MKEIKTLEKFRDLEIGKAEILGILADKILKKKIKVEINIDNVLKIINYLTTGRISVEEVIEWINVIHFSQLFRAKKEEEKCIVSIINELKKLDSDINQISDENLEKYLNALRNNKELV